MTKCKVCGDKAKFCRKHPRKRGGGKSTGGSKPRSRRAKKSKASMDISPELKDIIRSHRDKNNYDNYDEALRDLIFNFKKARNGRIVRIKKS